MKIDVLDHGFVRLVSYMQPASYEVAYKDPPDRGWTGDLEVVRNARVSHDADWRPTRPKRTRPDDNPDEYVNPDEKLIHYMMANGHTSPFEAMVFTFEIKCPIFIARQWHRHRTWSYNEVSARYAELPEEFYVPRPEHIGVQSKSNKQARELRDESENIQPAYRQASMMRTGNGSAFALYHILLGQGVPRELARTVLPLATYTRFFGTVDLHNLFHFLRLRLHAHAQWEMQQYGMALLSLIEPIVPVSVAAFERERAKREVSKD